MPEVSDLMNVVENVISSYKSSVMSIENLFDATYQFSRDFHELILSTKQNEKRIIEKLRENFAKNESLRMKDFDNMTQGILSTQDEREKEIKDLLKTYMNDQKEMANILGRGLAKFRESLAEGEGEKVKELRVLLKENLAKQEEKKEKITFALKKFQKEHQEMIKRINELLAKGKELRIKDLKSMVKEFKLQYEKRMVHNEERRDEVRSTLGDFKKERVEVAVGEVCQRR